MCTEQQTKAMVYEAFEEEGGLKEQMREQNKADLNSSILKVTSGFLVVFISSLVGFTVYLTGISNSVQSLDDFAKSGDRFTQQDGEILQLQIKANQTALSNVANAEQFRQLNESFIRLDERLRNKGI